MAKNMYEADGKEYVRKVGTRQEVVDGIVYCTSGGLKLDDLEVGGRKIVSKKRSALGRQRFEAKNPFVREDPKPSPPKRRRARRRRRDD